MNTVTQNNHSHIRTKQAVRGCLPYTAFLPITITGLNGKVNIFRLYYSTFFAWSKISYCSSGRTPSIWALVHL